MKTFQKQPRDHLDYDIDLSDWLESDDRIQAVEMIDIPEGVTVSPIGHSENRVKVWVKGGTSGESYKVTVLVHTNSRVKEVEFLIVVVEM